MGTIAAQTSNGHHWEPQPQAAQVVQRLHDEVFLCSPPIAQLANRLRDETGTRLVDWIDHLAVPADDVLAEDLIDSGFSSRLNGSRQVYSHASGLFPRILLSRQRQQTLAIKVERVEDVAACWPDAREIQGDATAAIRKVTLLLDEETNVTLQAWERHGSRGFDVADDAQLDPKLLEQHRQALAQRQRHWPDPSEGFAHAQELIARAITDLGVDRACDLLFISERDYWCERNQAAQVQRRRQQALGLGWGNHDHHTYRSSRRHFADLIATLETLGFKCRERFYAGREAGWGAQVLEQATTGVVIFADVDLSPHEVAADFAHEPLEERNELGTVGLWCELHGEAFLQAGMHHLECQFDFDAARQQLAAEGIECMPPFTNFPYLKQCFTVGEVWPVEHARIDALLKAGTISNAQAEKFAADGALGSHLEILERNDGYKGFNQTGISDIIQRTDPRIAQR